MYVVSSAHRVSRTITEYGSIEYRHRIPSTEDRVPSPSVKDRVPSAHRVLRTITECRVPSTEYREPSPSRTVTEYGSIEYRVPNTKRSIIEDRVPSPSVEYR